MAGLTKRAVDAAKIPERGWRWLGDEEVRGFGVVVYPSGTKTFALRYRTRSGRQRMLKLGHYGDLTVQEARKKAREEKVQVLDGTDPRVERERERVGIRTARQLLDRWLDDYAKTHRTRWKDDEQRLDRHLRPGLGTLSIEALTPERVAKWHRNIGKAGPVEANRCLETLRAAWRWADTHELLPDGHRDPTRRVKKFAEQSRDRWLRRPELERILKETAKQEDPFVRAAIPLLLLTGLRKRELLSARWENVDLDRGEIRLPSTKSGEAQVRILPRPAVEILRELPSYAESPFVFPSPGRPREHRRDIKRQWGQIREDAGLEDVTLHDLRRTAGSYMAQAGVPLQVIQQVLGHSHPGVTKLYARLSSDNERQALDALAAELGSVLGNGDRAAARSDDEIRRQLQTILERGGDRTSLAERVLALAREFTERES